jgi:hypothetical protein
MLVDGVSNTRKIYGCWGPGTFIGIGTIDISTHPPTKKKFSERVEETNQGVEEERKGKDCTSALP